MALLKEKINNILNKKIFVVIVTYNGSQWIEKCLNSLINSTIPLEIYAIDNKSSDNTINIIKSKFPSVNLIETGENLGFGRANNLGMRIALQGNGDYVFLLNQDAWVKQDCFERLINIHTSNPSYGILSPLHLDYEGENLESYFTSIIDPGSCPQLINDIFRKELKDIYDINFIHAAGWLISIKCINDVGGFDPLFFHYSEDIDYINRVKFYNYKIGLVPSAIFMHYGTHAGLGNKRNINFEKNFILLELKDIRGRLAGKTLVFLKGRFDKITSDILYRRFSDLLIDTKIFFSICFKYRAILKARKACREKGAYLSHK